MPATIAPNTVNCSVTFQYGSDDSILEQPSRDRTGKRQHRTDRQVDAAGEDDHRHADRQAQIDRNLPQHIQTVVDS